jgi:hypothetical protein
MRLGSFHDNTRRPPAYINLACDDWGSSEQSPPGETQSPWCTQARLRRARYCRCVGRPASPATSPPRLMQSHCANRRARSDWIVLSQVGVGRSACVRIEADDDPSCSTVESIGLTKVAP